MNFNQLNKQEKFSIRKYKSFGAASAVIGAIFFLSGGSIASANESQPTTESITHAATEPKAATEDVSVNSSDQPSISTRLRRRRDVSEASSQTEHGRLIAKDVSIKGAIGELYEDGTYILRPDGSGETVNLDNNNGGVNAMFGDASNPNYSLIKQFRLSGVINPDGKFLLQAGNQNFQPSTLDLRGLKKSESVPWLTEDDTHVTSVTFDKDYSLSDVPWISEMFDGATNLKLSNEQVTQLLKNFRPSGAEATLWRNVGVERLDLSTFDNSRLDLSKDEARRGSKAVFKDLIGLKEIVFGDKFDFNNYGRKNTPEAFMDTDLSKVERVTFAGNKTRNDKFVKDWLTDVQTLNDESKKGLYRDGQYVKPIAEAISDAEMTYEDGVYTLGPITNVRPAKPEDTSVTEVILPKIQYAEDPNQEIGYENRVEGVAGSKTTTTTYEWDESTRSYQPRTLEPVIRQAKNTIITKGTRPTTEIVTSQDFATRYVADPERAAGEKFTESDGIGSITMTTTTYSVNAETGVVTPTKGQPRVAPSFDKVVKVGTKSTTQTTVIPKVTVYREADPDAIYESRTTLSEGHDGSTTTTTTYTLNEQNGEVIPKIETVTIEKEDKIVKVGNRKTEVTFDAFTTVYEPEESMPFNEKREIYAGHAGEITNLIDYDVNPSTGELSNPRNVGGSRTVTLPREIAVGNKQVVTESIPATNRYVGNEEKERGYSNLIQQGRDGSRTITTIYTVNAKTGDLSNPTSTEASTPMTRNVYEVGAKPTITYLKEQNKIVKYTTGVKVDEDTGGLTDLTSTETISEDGAKDKIVTEELAAPVRYEKDDTREKDSENIRTEGKTGTKVTTTTYEVNPNTGEVIPTVHEPVITPATETVVKVAAKDKVVFSKDGNKVVKTTTTYTVDPTNGNITETSAKETISEDGAKDKIVTEELSSPVRYEKDDTREKDSENIRTEGKTGTKVTTTTYEVDSKTGEVIPTAHEPVITSATETIVKVAAKDKVVYSKEGNKVVKTTTTYTVDPINGNVSETSAKETISEDGAKDKIVTEVVEPKVVYEKDDSREVGSANIEISGKPGKKIVTFTHTVDEMTGKVIVAKSEKIIENATDTIVKVAAKDKFEVIEKDGKAFERHTVYAVDSKTGEISRRFDDKEITDKVSKSKKLPNTGLENASDLGAAAAFGLAAMVAIRRRLNQ